VRAALALASYAKQMRDEALLEMARKIRARAIQRGGELLEQEKRERCACRARPRQSHQSRVAKVRSQFVKCSPEPNYSARSPTDW
jgi:hypothetical protein